MVGYIVGLHSLPMQSTDHFIIYCRGVPVEYASLNPSVSMLNHVFPAVCKQIGHAYAIVLTNQLPAAGKTVKVNTALATAMGETRGDSDNDSEGDGW